METRKKKNKYKPYLCQNCYDTIISDKHKKKCLTVNINNQIVQDYDNNFKDMMIHGLNGCSCIIMLRTGTKRGNSIKIIMGLYTDKKVIKQTIARYYNIYDKFNIVIKTPELQIDNIFMALKNIKNINLVLIPYLVSLNKDIFQNTIYLKKLNTTLYYTNNQGQLIKIN